TMNEIAEDLNITKANLYYYYPDKLELIKDVIKHVTNEIHQKEKKIIATYRNNFLETMFSLLEVRSSYLKQYYVLHINENLEWIKDVQINELLKERDKEGLNQLKLLIIRAVDAGEVVIEDVDVTCSAYIESIKGIRIMHNVHDIIAGMP